MAASPKYKVYDDTGTYVASTKDGTLAAALIGAAGSEGWRVKVDGRLVWREGSEVTSPTESIDTVAVMIENRVRFNTYAAAVGPRAAEEYLGRLEGVSPA
jgi:hypothetical protein